MTLIWKNRRTLGASALMLAVAVLAALAASGAIAQNAAAPATSRGAARHARAATDPKPPAVTVPFRAGEKLEYRVLYSKYALNAAGVEVSALEERDFFGHLAWHFRALAHTVDTTRLLFPLDDQFDSYASAAGLGSLQYEMYLHEQGKQQTALFRMTTDSEPAPEDVTALRVSPGTRDPLSFLYAVRAADWQHAPELRGPVFDGNVLYDAVARVDMPDGTVNVPAGTLSASRIAIRLFDRGKEVTDTRLWVWIARDAAHTPVLIEGQIPIGDFRIELTTQP